MKSSINVGIKPRFLSLNEKAKQTLSKCERAVVCLMVLIAAFSLTWCIAIDILNADLKNGLFSGTLVFQPRDFQRLSERAKEIHKQALKEIQDNEEVLLQKEHELQILYNVSIITPESNGVTHLFKTLKSQKEEMKADEMKRLDMIRKNVSQTNGPLSQLDIEKDLAFLAKMEIDVLRTKHSASEYFMHAFPFLCQVLSISWASMCLIYQSTINKYWSLAKPWEIVVPSIFIFGFMTMANFAYILMGASYLNKFCTELCSELKHPHALSCGQAITVLRPYLRTHTFSFDFYLRLLNGSYIITFLLWFPSLLIMVLRLVYALDFQVVDVKKVSETSQKTSHSLNEAEFTEVLLNTPDYSTMQLRKVNDLQKSEDDFQSARSQQSEFALSLMESPA